MEEEKNQIQLLRILFAIILLVVLVKTTWVADDAFLTLRTVDNFVNGYSLTWNISERVQVYTHPLWMLLTIPFYALIRDPLVTMYILCLLVTGAVLLLFLNKIAKTSSQVILGSLLLLFSKTFIDYSTSGMENPLTHLLLVVFLILFYKSKQSFNEKQIIWLSMIAGLAAFNRMDTILLYFPFLAYLVIKHFSKKTVLYVLLGFTPFILWELFSLFYYGFLFPNTAYAKLNTGVYPWLLRWQGLYYFFDSLNRDPLSLVTILVSVILVFSQASREEKLLASGVVLYLLYVLNIGGDFMSGRFFSAPFLVAAVLLVRNTKPKFNTTFVVLVAAVLVLGFTPKYPTILSSAEDGSKEKYHSITDERLLIYHATGLLTRRKFDNFPYSNSGNASTGLEHHNQGKTFTIGPVNGMYAFYGGPQLYIVDTFGLGDALLARMPSPYQEFFFIGHFYRETPEGYRGIWKCDSIEDPNLEEYCEHLAVVVQSSLFAPGRLREIWRFNTGYYDDLMQAYLDEHFETRGRDDTFEP